MRKIGLATSVIFLIALLVSCVGLSGCGGNGNGTPPSGGTTAQTPITVSAGDLYAEYDANEVAASQKYEGKILLVDGVITSIGKDIADQPYIVLGKGGYFEIGGVQCYFDDENVVAGLSEGQIATVRGKCTGYFWDVELEDCTLESVSEPTPVNIDATFAITDWEQEYYEYSEEWSDYVTVYYEVENTGDVDVDYYEVYFTVTCTDGSEYSDWTNGLNLKVGHKLSDSTMVEVNGKEVDSVEVTDWELETY